VAVARGGISQVLPLDLQQHRYRQHQRGKPSLIGFEARTISGINSSRSAVNNSEHRDLRRDLMQHDKHVERLGITGKKLCVTG
jgi:hypothetical protein